MLDQSFTLHIASILDTLPSLQESAVEHGVHIHEYDEIINQVIALALSSELQLFSSHLAEWTFLIQKYPHLKSAGIVYARFLGLKKDMQSTENLEEARLLCRAILSILAGLPYNIPSNVQQATIKQSSPKTSLFRGSIVDWKKHKYSMLIICKDANQLEYHIDIQDIHASCLRFWKGATIHVTDCLEQQDRFHLLSTESTLCIIEPDILHTATDIAECSGNGRHISIGSMFIKKFSQKQSGIPLLAGIIVGHWLDQAIAGEHISISAIISKTIKSMPLQAMTALRDATDYSRLEVLCQELVNNLLPILDTFDGDIVSTETTFLAPIYGLMGRLDILMEFVDDPLHKTVIELKSGNAPSIGLPVNVSNITIPMGAWKNHVIQVACYNLLLDSAFPNRHGDSRLIYAKDVQSPIRNVMNSHHAKREAILIRNSIIALEHDIIKRTFSSFMHLFSDAELTEMPIYTREEISAFKYDFEGLDTLSRLYWLATLSFIMREHHSARIGSGSRAGLSSLWHSTIEEKQEQLSAIGFLNIDCDNSDFERFHLHVNLTKKSATMSSLRKGDLILFFAHEALQKEGTILGHIHKAVIKDIQKDAIIISLRNKYAFLEHFKNSETQWCIEADAGNESLFTGLMRSMGDFMRASQEKRDMILGKQRPRKASPYQGNVPDFLHETQSTLLRKILASKDYFLVQGPPGTGKTSALIHSIIQILHQDPEEKILLCAYTNRAVDELCAVVNKLDLSFLRLGSKQATAFPDHSLQAIAEKTELEELREFITQNRIIVSTVSTLHTHAEIFDWFSPKTMIVDEASQLLEPQLSGILTHAERFILIGDERQLPAVITQDIKGTAVNHPLFNEIGLTDFRMSLFERLLRLCIENGDDHAYGMLTMQARMHEDIARIVSKLNYHNKLQSMNEWQTTAIQNPLPEYPGLHWIDMHPEHQFKIHKAEAELSIELAMRAFNHGNTHSIGIITPFRSQIALIQSLIPEHARDAIIVDTVERFQGSERDLIIISLAIHSPMHMKGIASITEFDGEKIDRKLNVALTRARKQCIILGVPSALEFDSPYYVLWKMLKHQA